MGVQMVFPNFAVADVERAKAYYTGLGFSINEQYSDERTACVVLNDTAAIMLLEHDRFAEFLIEGQQPATRGQLETLTAVLLESREAVDAFADRVADAGGVLSKPVTEQYGVMYGGQATDPDGHVLDFFFMAE